MAECRHCGEEATTEFETITGCSHEVHSYCDEHYEELFDDSSDDDYDDDEEDD